MSETQRDDPFEALRQTLSALDKVKVAVSGGVDSMSLGILAHRILARRAHLFHAVSPAVPPDATARVKATAEAEGWRLSLIDAGEFDDPEYLRNPYRRCFHCKKNLYGSLAQSLGGGVILSGANHDDLDDFRPGLQAAEQFGVRHPFVECGIGKARIRDLCRQLGYPELAALPASPCLSSRVETGLPIQAAVLGFVHQVESRLRQSLQADLVRCRVRPDSIAIQLDKAQLSQLSEREAHALSQHIRALAEPLALPRNVQFEPYRMGSAFVDIN